MDKKMNLILGGRDAGKHHRLIETIEKDFKKKGCSFEVAFRALNEGVWVEHHLYHTVLEKHDVRGIELNGLGVISNICSSGECDFTCYYKDYKKTWWLKADKSE